MCPAQKGDQHAGGPRRERVAKWKDSNVPTRVFPHTVGYSYRVEQFFRASYSVIRLQFVLAYRISRAHSLLEISPPPNYGVGCTKSPRGRPATGVTISNCDVTGMMQANAAVAQGQPQAVCLVPRVAVADQLIKIAEPVPK